MRMGQNRNGFSKYNFTIRLGLVCILVPIIALLRYRYHKYSGGTELTSSPERIKFHSLGLNERKIELDLGILHLLESSVDSHRVLREANTGNNDVIQDSCAAEWTAENLIGRCWGLTTSTNIPNIEPGVGEKAATSSDECKKLCCNLGDKCITWQFWGASGICKAGKHVRLGGEGGNSPRWCEPEPPQKWNGAKRNLTSSPLRNKIDPWVAPSTCGWVGQQPGQCFGLGPERLNSEKERISEGECAAGCCADPNCMLWQHLPTRGCFYNKNQLHEEPHCDQYGGVYVGGRKKVDKKRKKSK